MRDRSLRVLEDGLWQPAEHALVLETHHLQHRLNVGKQVLPAESPRSQESEVIVRAVWKRRRLSDPCRHRPRHPASQSPHVEERGRDRAQQGHEQSSKKHEDHRVWAPRSLRGGQTG